MPFDLLNDWISLSERLQVVVSHQYVSRRSQRFRFIYFFLLIVFVLNAKRVHSFPSFYSSFITFRDWIDGILCTAKFGLTSQYVIANSHFQIQKFVTFFNQQISNWNWNAKSKTNYNFSNTFTCTHSDRLLFCKFLIWFQWTNSFLFICYCFFVFVFDVWFTICCLGITQQNSIFCVNVFAVLFTIKTFTNVLFSAEITSFSNIFMKWNLNDMDCRRLSKTNVNNALIWCSFFIPLFLCCLEIKSRIFRLHAPLIRIGLHLSVVAREYLLNVSAQTGAIAIKIMFSALWLREFSAALSSSTLVCHFQMEHGIKKQYTKQNKTQKQYSRKSVCYFRI